MITVYAEKPAYCSISVTIPLRGCNIYFIDRAVGDTSLFCVLHKMGGFRKSFKFGIFDLLWSSKFMGIGANSILCLTGTTLWAVAPFIFIL